MRWRSSASAPAAAMHIVEYAGHPEAERVVVVMGSGAETVARDRRRAQRAGRARRRAAGAAVPAVPRAARCSTRCRPTVRRIAVLDRTKEPGSIGEPLFLDVVAALAEAHADGERAVMPRVIGGRYGLSSKEFTPGMVAGVFAELARERPRRRLHDRHQRRRLRHEPPLRPGAGHRAARHGARGLLRPGLGRHRRRQQEHDQDPRRRGGPARAGLLRLRLQEVGLADGVAPALRAAADPRALPRAAGELRRLPPVRPARPGRRARPGRARRHAAAQLPAPPGRGLGRAAAPGAGADPGQAHRASTRSTPAGSPARPVSPGRINIVLQTCFFAISGVLPRERGHRADQGGDRQDLRQARRRGGRAQPRGGRPVAGRAAPDRACPTA